MSAAWFQFRVAFRTYWRAWTAIGVLAGIASGVVMIAVAGARRTDSSLHRVVVDHRSADVVVNPNNGQLTTEQWRRIDTLPQVAEYAHVKGAPMVTLTAAGQPDLAFLESPRGAVVLSNADGRELRAIDRPAIVAGRLTRAGEVNAFVANETAAAALHLHVGSTLGVGFFDASAIDSEEIPKLQKARLELVGIIRSLNDATRARDDPRLAPTLLLSQALSQRISHLGAFYEGQEVRLRDPAQLATFEASVRKIAGSAVLDLQELSGTVARARRGVRPYVLALWFFAALAALTGAAVVLQIATRQQRHESSGYPILRALGASRGDRSRVAMLRGLTIGAIAAAIAAIVAVAGSGLMPIGPLRALEPHQGVDVDMTVLFTGLLLVGVLMVLQSVIAGHRVSPRANRPARIGEALSSTGRSPSVVMGVRLALDPGRGDAAIPLRSTVFGVAVAVAALVATLVYAAGLSYFTSTPRMYGWAWSYQVESGGVESTAGLQTVVDALVKDPHVRAAAVGAYGQLTIEHRTIGSIAVQTGRGVPVVDIVSGREPKRANEIALGGATLRTLNKRVGDAVAVAIGSESRGFTIVGRAVFARFAPYPASEPTGLGIGAAMALDGLARFGPLDSTESSSPLAASPFVLVNATRDTTARLIGRVAFPHDANAAFILGAQRPNEVRSYEQLRRTPLVLSGLLLLLAIATLAHLLISGVRRRRRDLGILRALGFTSGQLRASVLAQATTLIGLVLLVSVPLGVIAGRALWAVTSDWLGIRTHDVVPLAAVGLVVLGAVVVGNIAALIPAISAGRVDPAEILRAE